MAKVKVQYEESDHFFVNPYNFVPVNLQKTRRSDVAQPQKEDMLTGYLQCRIKCRTPLAIPDAEKKMEEPIEGSDDKQLIHNQYPFFTVNVEPIIPGSAIRGVIRNVYETLTDSCFGAMQTDVAITVRSNRPFRPGLLKRNGDQWELYPAERHLVVVDEEFHKKKLGEGEHPINLYDPDSLRSHYDPETGVKVYFDLSDEDYRKTIGEKDIIIGKYVKQIAKRKFPGWREGYLCFGEHAPKRHFQSIFEQADQNPVDIAIGDSDIQKLEDILREYRDDKKNRLYDSKHLGYQDYEGAKKAGVIPVYYKYKEQSGKLYMSFAALGRKAYDRTWDDITAEKSRRKCNGRNNLCPACMLFGTVEGDKLGSRIRFTDAHCIGDAKNVIRTEVTFAELSSPKMSYAPFYLKETGANVKVKVNYADGYDSPGLEIRGRKFYWHHTPEEAPSITKNNRNATFEVIKEGTGFAFRIYFDGITKRQLELLAMSVHLNENEEDGKMCHKMGHGKPLGYGSAKIFIESCKLRSFSPEDGWRETDGTIPCDVACDSGDKTTKEALFAICDFDAVQGFGDAKVEYPKIEYPKIEYPKILWDAEHEGQPFTENDLASHKWFANNYKLGKLPPNKVLPDIQTEIRNEGRTLKKYTAKNISDS